MSPNKTSIRYLNNISWLSPGAGDFVTGDHIDIYRINISSNLILLDNFLAIMPPDEIERSERYFQIKDRNRYIVSRGALRNIFSKYLSQQPESVQFKIGLNKKPHLINTGNVQISYNISHSGDWILLAITNSEIGADTEFKEPDFNYKDIINDCFSEEEVDYIKQDQSVERFYLLWTRKESLTKATGKGLDDDLKIIPSLDGEHHIKNNVARPVNNWLVNSFELYDQYVASVASNFLIKKIKFWDIKLNHN